MLPHGLFLVGLRRRPGFLPYSRILNMSPLSFHPFLFCSQKRNGWSPKKKPPPISLCLIPVRTDGWLETRFAQTVEPEFPPPLTSIAPSGPARLRMGGKAEWDFDVPMQEARSQMLSLLLLTGSQRNVVPPSADLIKKSFLFPLQTFDLRLQTFAPAGMMH